MRKWTDGNGADSSAAVRAFLATSSQPQFFTLYKIQLVRWTQNPAGTFTNTPFKTTWLLTDFPGAVNYTPLGVFSGAIIKHDVLNFAVDASDASGASVSGNSDFQVTWTPNSTDILIPAYAFGGGGNPFSPSMTALQAVNEGMFDGAYVYVYKVLMNGRFDANTYGVTLMTMGLVDKVEQQGGQVVFTCTDPINQKSQQIPSQLITADSRFARVDPLVYLNAAGQEDMLAGLSYTQTAQVLVSFNFVNLFSIHPTGAFNNGVLMWTAGALQGMRRSIRLSVTDVGAWTYTFYLSTPFPFDANLYNQGYAFGLPFTAYLPTAVTSSDTFYDGFPNVPLAEDGI